MNCYIGTKMVNATPMSREDYNRLRGWELPSDENGADEGYLVEYTDGGGKPNVRGYEGYVSWSPKAQFERAYRETNGLPFGLAIEALKQGRLVARQGWNGKNMWLRMIFEEEAHHFIRHAVLLRPWIAMKTVDGTLVPWTASQTDILADDWYIV